MKFLDYTACPAKSAEVAYLGTIDDRALVTKITTKVVTSGSCNYVISYGFSGCYAVAKVAIAFFALMAVASAGIIPSAAVVARGAVVAPSPYVAHAAPVVAHSAYASPVVAHSAYAAPVAYAAAPVAHAAPVAYAGAPHGFYY